MTMASDKRLKPVSDYKRRKWQHKSTIKANACQNKMADAPG